MRSVTIFSLIMLLGLFVVSSAHGSELKRTITKVEQMICSSCLRVIDAELRKVPGIMGMTARFRAGLVAVDHEKDVASNEIAGIITDLGYPATVVSSQEITDKEVNLFQRSGFGRGAGCCNPGGTSPIAESWKELKRRLLKRGENR